MYSGESEIQARRRTLAVLQDEMRRVVDAARDLSVEYAALVKGKSHDLQAASERIRKAEEDVEVLRRTLTRELAEIGTMMLNREDLLRAGYDIEDVVSFISSVSFRLTQIGRKVKRGKLHKEIGALVDMSVEAVQKLSEVVRSLSINPAQSIELAQGVENIEREIDQRYRFIIGRAVKKVKPVKDFILLKDIVEGIEEVADRCLQASDSVTILAIGL